MDMPEKAHYLGTSVHTKSDVQLTNPLERCEQTPVFDICVRHTRTPRISLLQNTSGLRKLFVQYQEGVKCSRWWHLVRGCYEKSVDLCIRLHFDKPLHKLRRLWFVATELMSRTLTREVTVQKKAKD